MTNTAAAGAHGEPQSGGAPCELASSPSAASQSEPALSTAAPAQLTLKDYLGYGSASTADSLTYSFFSVFYLFFLTTVAGIRPALAGTIIAIGTIWNAVFNPLIGYFSDQVRTRYGRRRPLIFLFSIPLSATCFFMMLNVPLPATAKTVYYGIMAVLFWTCYTGFFVPYCALGAEWTKDYESRTTLRLYASFFNMLGTLVSMSCPTLAVGIMTQHGISTSAAWSVVGAIVGVVSLVSILVTLKFSKEVDPPCEPASTADANANTQEEREKTAFSLLAIFREYKSIALLPPMRYLILASVAGLICYMVLMGDIFYFLSFNLGFTETQSSAALLARAFIGIALLPLTGKMIHYMDKRATTITFFLTSAFGLIALRVLGIDGAASFIAYLLFYAVGTCAYWQILPSIYYDMSDYDQMVNGKSRAATIMSFQGLVEAVACAIGSQTLGIVLDLSGFQGDAAEQSALALSWIFNATTIIPAAALIVGAYGIWRYPITREKHAEILAAIADKAKKA